MKFLHSFFVKKNFLLAHGLTLMPEAFAFQKERICLKKFCAKAQGILLAQALPLMP